MHKIHFTFFLFIQTLLVFSQTKPVTYVAPPSYKIISGDCDKAIHITVGSISKYGPAVAPDGFGKVQEIKSKSNSVFEGEHNTAWYLLSITIDGKLIFDIIPEDSTNDYDFLVYTYTDSGFCNAFQKNKFKPVRSNLSNIKRSVAGFTGAALHASDEFVSKGVGESYSKYMNVRKGEKYMLILDNVTPKGKGHTLQLKILRDVEIKGNVVNSDKIPLVADVTLTDPGGRIVEETKSDEKGNYDLKTSIADKIDYHLTIAADSVFFDTKTINTSVLKNTSVFPLINSVLPKLKKGEKYRLGNINFYGNLATLLPESFPSVESLYMLLKKNKKMVIRIEGHVNDPGGFDSKTEDQKLSDDRASAIYDYLVKKGVDKERMTTLGLSNTQPLYKRPSSELQSSANRRVEIRVISIY